MSNSNYGISSVDPDSLIDALNTLKFEYSASKSTYLDEFKTNNYIKNLFSELDKIPEKIENLKQVGYTYADGIKQISQKAVDDLPELTNYSENELDGKISYVNVNTYLNLRESASTSSNSLAQLTNNTKLTILEETDDWAYVKTEDNKYGYVYKKYIKDMPVTQERNNVNNTSVKNTVPNTETSDNKTSDTEISDNKTSDTETSDNKTFDTETSITKNIKYVNTNGGNLNVRKTPDKNHAPSGTLKNGEEVIVEDIEGDWIKIRAKNDPSKTGYVYKKYLKDSD